MLKELRTANIARAEIFQGNDKIDLAFRGLELAGEIGELCNKLKKFIRLAKGIGETTYQEGRDKLLQDIAEELGDGVICLDLIAIDLGIDLDKETRKKFNKSSRKFGLDVFLEEL